MTTNKNNKDLLIGFIALLWLLGVTIAYMVTHKPFTPEQFLSILLLIWRIVVPLMLVILAGGIGMLARVEKLSLPPLTTVAFSAGLGFGVIGLYALLWGSLVGVNFTIYILPLVGMVLIRKNILNWIRLWLPKREADSGLTPGTTGGFWSGSTWIGKFILASVSILILCQLVIALAPPLYFDALTYHFSIPQAYIQQEKIYYIPDLMFWGMPQQNEMLYMLTMLAGGVESAAMLSWLVGILALAGLADFARQAFGVDPALLAVAGLMSGMTLVTTLGSGYVEWASILYGLLMLVSLLSTPSPLGRGSGVRGIVFAGIFAGMALSSKYTSGIALLAGLVVILAFRRSLKPALIFGGVAVLVFAPWMVKNGLATGNPVYPLVLATTDFDAVRMAFYNFAPLKQDWSRLVLLPWLATVMGVDGHEGYSASIGPLMLAFSLLAFAFWGRLDEEKRRVTLVSTTVVVTGMLVWALGSQFRGLLIQSRLYVAIFPAWALMAAAGFGALSGLKVSNVRFGNIASALVALSLFFVVYETVLTTTASGAADVALGLRSGESYLQNYFGEYPNAMKAIKALPEGSRALMLWETRGFYCEPACDSDEVIDRWYHDWRTTGDVDALIAKWRAQGYTHLLLRDEGMNFVKTEDELAPFKPEDWQALDALLAKLTVVKKFGESYTLYALEK